MNEFVQNLNDVFALFGQIQAKRMFGGYGIYHDGLMFALVADDELYLKTDTKNLANFIELGLHPFEYEQRGKKIKLSYYLAPEHIFDDPEQAREWAMRAFDAALRAQQMKKKTKKSKAK